MATILIADDEEPLRGFVARGLQLDGHVIDAAAGRRRGARHADDARRRTTTCC